MATYLIEMYVPRAKAQEAGYSGPRLRAAIEELAQESGQVRFVRTMLLPDDETCFHVLDATSSADVEHVCKLAGIDQIRVVCAIENPSEVEIAYARDGET